MNKAQTHLKEGEKAPDFSGINETGETVSLIDFKGKKLILFFYPKDNTPGCTNEVCNLRDYYELLLGLGFELLGVSPDGEKKHQNFIKKHSLPFPLIADTEMKMIKDYGVWGPKFFMGKHYEGLLRTTFIIDGQGTIERIFTEVKTQTHVAQILKSYIEPDKRK